MFPSSCLGLTGVALNPPWFARVMKPQKPTRRWSTFLHTSVITGGLAVGSWAGGGGYRSMVNGLGAALGGAGICAGGVKLVFGGRFAVRRKRRFVFLEAVWATAFFTHQAGAVSVTALNDNWAVPHLPSGVYGSSS